MPRTEQNKRSETPLLSQVLNPVTTTELSIQRFSLAVDGLRASRLRVVHISDPHVTSSLPWSYYDRIHSAVRDLAPDLIFMTGDYVSHAKRIGLFARWLE